MVSGGKLLSTQGRATQAKIKDEWKTNVREASVFLQAHLTIRLGERD